MGSQNQLLGYISLMLVMETVSIAQIELEQSFVTSPSGKAETPAWQEHHTEMLNSCENLGVGGARGDFVFKLSYQSSTGLIFCFNGSSDFLCCVILGI